MSRLGILGAVLAIGIYGGTFLKSETPHVTEANAPQVTTALHHGDEAVTQVRWGRFFGGWRGGYYRPFYRYYGPAYRYRSYYSPYARGYYGFRGPYVWWW